MEILFVLIPLSVLLIAFALWSFVWSVKNDQFEDLDRQGWSILFDSKDGDPPGGKTDKPDETENARQSDGTAGASVSESHPVPAGHKASADDNEVKQS